MKITIHSSEFADKVKRVMPICCNSSILPACASIAITAKNNEITFYANNLERCVSITADGSITEEGVAIISIDRIKQLLNVKDILNIYTTDNSKTVVVTNGKKKSEVAVSCSENEMVNKLSKLNDDSKLILEIPSAKEFADTLDILSATVSQDNSKVIYTGYHINSKYIETISGYHCLRRDISKWHKGDSTDIIIGGAIYYDFKKILGKDSAQKPIKVYDNLRHTIIVGEEFEYIIRKIDGNYLDVASLFPTTEKYKFTPNNKEMFSIAKEYKGYKVEKKRSPMMFSKQYGYLTTSMLTQVIHTSDVITFNGDFPDELFYGVDAQLLFDIVNGFKKAGEEYTIIGTGAISPWAFIGNEYSALLVPIKAEQSYIENTKRFLAA